MAPGSRRPEQFTSAPRRRRQHDRVDRPGRLPPEFRSAAGYQGLPQGRRGPLWADLRGGAHPHSRAADGVCLGGAAGGAADGGGRGNPSSYDPSSLSLSLRNKHVHTSQRERHPSSIILQVVVLHNMLLHKSDLNHSGKPRRAFSAWLTSHRPGTEHWATIFPTYRPNSKGEPQGVNGRPDLQPTDSDVVRRNATPLSRPKL